MQRRDVVARCLASLTRSTKSHNIVVGVAICDFRHGEVMTMLLRVEVVGKELSFQRGTGLIFESTRIIGEQEVDETHVRLIGLIK